MTRQERILRFQIEIYKAASFFNMSSTGSKSLDEQVNQMAEPLTPMPNPQVAQRPRIKKDSWKKRKIVRGNSM